MWRCGIMLNHIEQLRLHWTNNWPYFPGNYFSGWNKNSTHTLKREWDICSKETYPTDNPSLAGVSVEEARTAAAACTRTRQSNRCRKRQLPLILQQHTGWSAGGMLPGHAGPRQDCQNQSVIPRTLQPLIQTKGRFSVTSSWRVQKWKVVHKHFSQKNFLKCQRCLLFICYSLWSLVTLYLTSNYLVCDLYLPRMWPQFTSYLYSPRIWPLFTSYLTSIYLVFDRLRWRVFDLNLTDLRALHRTRDPKNTNRIASFGNHFQCVPHSEQK